MTDQPEPDDDTTRACDRCCDTGTVGSWQGQGPCPSCRSPHRPALSVDALGGITDRELGPVGHISVSRVPALRSALAAGSGSTGAEPERPPTAAQVLAHATTSRHGTALISEGAVEVWSRDDQAWVPFSFAGRTLLRMVLESADPDTPQPGLRLVSGDPGEET